MNKKDVKIVDVPEEPKISGLASGLPLPLPGTFSLLYESRDGRLCLFEDKDGHITAVRSDRFC